MDTTAYSKLPNDPTNRFKREMYAFVYLNSWVYHKHREKALFLMNKQPTIPVVYILSA